MGALTRRAVAAIDLRDELRKVRSRFRSCDVLFAPRIYVLIRFVCSSHKIQSTRMGTSSPPFPTCFVCAHNVDSSAVASPFAVRLRSAATKAERGDLQVLILSPPVLALNVSTKSRLRTKNFLVVFHLPPLFRQQSTICSLS
jgi:hypothetical protein